MLRTGNDYREGIRDGREIWMDGEKVKDVTTHKAFKPIVDCRARMYDMAHEAKYAETMSYLDGNNRNSILLKRPEGLVGQVARLRRDHGRHPRCRHPRRRRDGGRDVVAL
jgi:aromatic ring hydroxylase